ncbi:MAG: hypothetical protein K6D02_07945 [Lachnospiraceae bacterium]|nr:hypothetical protein [Lachnospiraceae bacterium]
MDIKISVKTLGKSFLVPILFNSILIPIIVIMVAKTQNEYNLLFSANVMTQMFTPFLGSFVVFTYMSKYIDTRGNEIYFVVNKNKSSEILKLYCIYIITNTFWFIVYSCLNKKFALEWVHIIILTFFYMVATYFLCFWFKSVSLASIPIFLYTIYSIVGLEAFNSKLSYYECCGVTGETIVSKYFYFIVAAFFLLIVGKRLNNSFEKYNE